MPQIPYETKAFADATLDRIRTAVEILEEYAQQGYDLTLRQLFYQHVARALIENTERSYKRLGKIVNDARMAGYIDWERIIDRTRNMRSIAHWDSPAEIIDATARSFKVDLWASQENYVEVWIEKDALVGVIEPICRELDVPYFSCRGYTSQSEMWSASQRLLEKVLAGKHVTILHLGDHDPSGIDMTRDIQDRLNVFIASDYVRARADEQDVDLSDNRQFIKDTWREGLRLFDVDRIALTMAQVQQYNAPPNPAKVTDSRAAGYIRKYGHQSWELDALDPPVMTALIRDRVEALIEDEAAWEEAVAEEREGQRLLRQASAEWTEIVDNLGADAPDDEEDEDG